MKTKVLACVSIIALTSSSLVIAGNRPGAVTLRLADGYAFFADRRHLENSSIPTIELGYEFDEKWAIQAGASVVNTDVDGGGPNSGAHGFYYLLDGVYHIGNYGHFVPYAQGGVGITSLKVHNTNDPTDQTNVNIGLGSQFFIDKSIALAADIRDVYTLSGGKNDVMLTAGITFLFGGGYPEPAPVYKK